MPFDSHASIKAALKGISPQARQALIEALPNQVDAGAVLHRALWELAATENDKVSAAAPK